MIGLAWALACTPPPAAPPTAAAVDPALRLQVTPAQLDFGPVGFGDEVVAAVQLINRGAAAIELAAPVLEGSSSFRLIAGEAWRLEPYQVAHFQVAYRAQAANERATLRTRADDQPLDIPLLGEVASPTLSWSPQAVNLGPTPIGCPISAPLTLQHDGPPEAPALQVRSWEVAGEGFSVSPASGSATLLPGETFTLELSFLPGSLGEAAGSLRLSTDQPGAEELIDLRAVGLDPGLCRGHSTRQVSLDLPRQAADLLLVVQPSKLGHTGLVQPLLDAVAAQVPDLAVGVARFDGYAAPEDPSRVPFTLDAPLSRDLVDAGARAETVRGSTVDRPVGFEGLVQALTGRGYDLDCDGALGPGDVPPFLAHPADAFGGAVPGAASPYGLGLEGGLGGRRGVTPFVVMLAADPFLDPGLGDPAPGGCPRDADFIEAFEELLARRAVVIGLLEAEDGLLRSQLEALAVATGATGDPDGDGRATPWVLRMGEDPRDLAAWIAERTEGPLYHQVHLELDDPLDRVVSVDPLVWEDLPAGQPAPFRVVIQGEVRDEAGPDTAPLSLTWVADGQVVGSSTLHLVY